MSTTYELCAWEQIRTHILHIPTSLTYVPFKSHVIKGPYLMQACKMRIMTDLHGDTDQACSSHSLTSNRKWFQHSVTVKEISTHCHPTLNLRDFLETTLYCMWMDFTAAGRLCLCSRLFTHLLKRCHVSQSALTQVCTGSADARGDNIHHKGFPPHNGPHVYPPAGFWTPVMDKIISVKHTTSDTI